MGSRSPKNPMPPKLVWLVVVAVTLVFVTVAITAVINNRHIDPELYALMGLVVGGVLGYGVLKR